MLTEILVLLALVLVNGLFSGAEIAIVTVRKTRIEQLVGEGNRSARAIGQLRANPERFLATVQVGITVVGAAAAAYGGDTLANRLTPLLAPVLGTYAHQFAFAVVVAGISYLSLVLGELVPKSLALRAGESYALRVARPLLGLASLARPLIWLLTKSSNVVLKVFGDSTSFTEARMSTDELKAMLEEAGEVGELHPRIGEIAARAVDFNDLRAKDVMVPRTQIQSIRKEATIDELRRFAIDVPHSKIPLFEGEPDNIVAYVRVRDAFTNSDAHAVLSTLSRPVRFVPESMRAIDTLQSFQGQGTELAIVVDEHGGTAGLLTREDLAEELFGELGVPATAASQEIQMQSDGSAIIAGATEIREVNRVLDLRLPEMADWRTMGGMTVSVAGRIPSKGEVIQVPNGPSIEILDASPRRVRAVRMLSSKGRTQS
ncbi:MAG TPA: hemolysin family protein [Polyangiaceae bacterium]|nr:hemolysin family protein [Polyangiaceae bacterium]